MLVCPERLGGAQARSKTRTLLMAVRGFRRASSQEFYIDRYKNV